MNKYVISAMICWTLLGCEPGGGTPPSATDPCPHPGDVCDFDGSMMIKNEEAMSFDDQTQLCSKTDYSKIDDCINELAPPPPTIRRGISTGRDDSIYLTAHMLDLPIDHTTYAGFSITDKPMYPTDNIVLPMPPDNSKQTQIGPTGRTSSDGRLVYLWTYDDVFAFTIFRPEVTGAQGRIKSTAKAMPEEVRLKLTNLNGGATLCDNSSGARTAGRELTMQRNPKSCTATEGGNIEKGDCYDVTILTGGAGQGLVSADLRFYVKDPKTINANIASTKLFKHGEDNLDLDNGGTSPENLVRSEAKQIFYTNYCECNDTSCAQPVENNIQMFEPITTSDGRMLVMNLQIDGSTIVYAINDDPNIPACHAEGFKLFKPLSCLPVDNRTQAKVYQLGQGTPDGYFRDSKGAPILPGQVVSGAYPWIDRKGKNIIYAQHNSYRDAWYAKQTLPPNTSDRKILENYPDQNANASGMGIVVLGLWTQGKIVVMDNMLNPTDWSGGTRNDKIWWTGVSRAPHNFKMALYREEPQWLRPYKRSDINSPENQFNFLKNQSPSLPFDVVWRAYASSNHNAQIVFDEYLNNNAFVIAHMNAPHTTFGNNFHAPEDGFVPNHPSRNNMRFAKSPDDLPEFRFRTNPKLQNASTSIPQRAAFSAVPPESLTVKGGARVEPVALGGVLGKGLYLDGLNDHIEVNFQRPNHQHWFYSIWLEAWAYNKKDKPRAVFYWSDNSWVGISEGRIYAYNGQSRSHLTIDVPQSMIYTPKKYFHFALKTTQTDKYIKLSFYINGQPVCYQNNSAQSCELEFVGTAFRLDGVRGTNLEQSWFVVGKPYTRTLEGTQFSDLQPWKGWIDEFRIYAMSPNLDAYTDEYICNLALGSLMMKNGEPFCEQLDLENDGFPSEIAVQNAKECADKVHFEIANPNCLRKTMLGIQTIDSGTPRPDESKNTFCTTCHLLNHPIPELSVDALVPSQGVNQRTLDPKRQPMDWPALISGYPLPPSTYPKAVQPMTSPPDTYVMDYWIHQFGKQ